MNEPIINHDAERSVLGGILTNADAIAAVADWLPLEAFGDRRNRAIYAAMLRLWSRRVPATMVTVNAELEAMKPTLDRAAAFAYVTDLALTAELTAGMYVPFHAELVMTAARRRHLADQGAALVKAAYDGDPDVEETVRALRNAVTPFGKPGSGPVDHGDDMAAFQDTLLRRWSGNLVETVVPFGVREVDKMLGGGMRGGDMVILAARTSMGKTAMMLHAARHSRSLVFSLEMTKQSILTRLATTEAGVPYDVGTSQIGDVIQRDKLLQATETVASWPLTIFDRTWTTATIEAEVERRQRDGAVDAVFIDHLSKLGDEFRGRVTDYERISALSGRCKNLALRRDVPVVVLSQLNREVEHRKSCLPFLSDLRESGKLEEDADVVMLLYRRSYYVDKGMVDEDANKDWIHPSEGDPSWQRLSLSIAKNRNGVTGGVDLGWERAVMRIHEIERRAA